jgi:glucose-6-phosphate isomerase
MGTAELLASLAPHAERIARTHLRALVAGDPARAADFQLRAGPITAQFARQRLDREALAALLALGVERDLPGAMRRLIDGEQVNTSEGRPALHTALRGDAGQGAAALAARAEAIDGLARMHEAAAALLAQGVTDIVSVGIGGSDLGPRFVVEALRHAGPAGGPRLHFVSNVDAHAIESVLAGLDPVRTGGLVISKSFGTQETLLNGGVLRDWLGGTDRLLAVTANPARAAAWGVPGERVLPMWDWVGGRYSLWSAVGLPILLALGERAFGELLEGAADMDRHALDAPLAGNLPAWHALVAVWNRVGLDLPVQAVLPYDDRLARLPDYLQQLVMESLGKSVHLDGRPIGAPTGPVIFGGPGTDVQHSFFQSFHQGADAVPAEFIGVIRPDHDRAGQHHALLANLLAQSEALANGEHNADPHKAYPGNRPSTVLLLDALTPASLGALIALYEHSTWLQGVLYGINPFDQWGVELGKRIATGVLAALEGEAAAGDPVTARLIATLVDGPLAGATPRG